MTNTTSGPFGFLPEVESVLRECVRERAEAAVLTHGRAGMRQCKFHRLDEGAVVFEVQRGDLSDVMRTTSCSVSFHHAGRVCVFMSSVLGYRFDGVSLPCMHVGLPPMLLVEARQTVRLPVPPESGVRARVSAHEGWWTPEVRDVSLGGVRLAFAPEDVPDWGIGALVRIDLSVRMDDTASLTAVVVRRAGNEYGLAFGRHETARDGENVKRLKQILFRLQEHLTPGATPVPVVE